MEMPESMEFLVVPYKITYFIFALGFIVGILGNLAVVIMVICKKNLREMSSSGLIITMALVDCISASLTNLLSFELVS